MDKVFIEYLKCNDTEEELEIENFWMKIKQEIYILEEDTSLVYFEMRRGHQPAVSGEYAEIFIQIFLSIPPFLLATIELWEKIYNHIEKKRENKQIVRVLNLSILENICSYDLYTNKNERGFKLVESKKLIDNNIEEGIYDSKYDFVYDETLEKVRAAEITFESNKFYFKYTIDSDGEIFSYKKIAR